MKLRIVYAAAIALASMWVSQGWAQQRVVASNERAVSESSGTVLETPVTIDLRDVPIRDAVKALGQHTNVRVLYQTEVFGKSSRRVTLQARGLALGEAFARVLEGTSLQAVAIAKDGVAIERYAGSLPAVANGTVMGRVVHAKTRQPVSGAMLTVGDNAKGIATDKEGAFRLSLAAGEYTLHVRALGFLRQARKVTLAGEQTVQMDIVLEPSASVLDEVVVTGSIIATERKTIPTPITVITAEDIEERGITRLEELFRGGVPGVVALEEGAIRYRDDLGAMQSARVYARGASTATGDANPLKTYVDGVEILDGSYLGTIDPKSIERVEIITGPQAATLYGAGAMGGVMQIFTKKGQAHHTPEVVLGLRYGMLENNFSSGRTPTHAHSVSMSGGMGLAFSYSLNLSYNYVGQWQPGLFNRNYGVSVGATHTAGPIFVSGSFSTTAGKNGTTGNGGLLLTSKLVEWGEWKMDGFPVRSLTKQVSASQAQTAALSVDYRPQSTWQHSITVGRHSTNFALDPVSPTFRADRDSLYVVRSSYGQRTTVSYRVTLQPQSFGPVGFDLTFGLTGSWGRNVNIGGCQATQFSSSYIGCFAGEGASVNGSMNERNVGGLGQWRIGIMEQLFVTLGLRAERNPHNGRKHRTDWTPTNGITYAWEYGDLSVKLLGSYGRATRSPDPDMRREVLLTYPDFSPSTFTARLANDSLRPERSQGPQGGLEVYYGNRASFSISHHSQTVTDLIENVQGVDTVWLYYAPADFLLPNGIQQYRNIGTVKTQGWESTASLSLWHLTARGTYTWNDSRVVESTEHGVVPGQSFWGLPTHFSSGQLSYASGGTNVTLIMNYIGTAIRRSGGNADGRIENDQYNARLKMYVGRMKDFNQRPAIVAPSYVKSDLTVSHRLSVAISGTLTITNLGNSFGNDLGPGYPSLGRKTLLGLSVRYPQR